MKIRQLNYVFVLLISGFGNHCFAQARPDKIYTMSGVGFAFPLGAANDYFKPKFSSELGFNIGIGKGHLFLYPQASFQAYSINQLDTNSGYSYTLHKGRSTTYLLNLALGYRKIIDKLAWYGFVGGGGGIILTPQVSVDNTEMAATLSHKNNEMTTIEAGAGLEYDIGGAAIFIEGNYLYGFKKIQNRKFNSIPLFIGIKPNLIKLFKGKKG